MDYGNWKPKDIRKLIREGKITGQTSGMCNGYAQANMAILPKSLAFDFLLFTQRNRKPCPLLDVTEAGNPEPKLAAPGADLRYDIPKYRIYKKGILTDEVTDLSGYWQDDYVAFLLGCSFSFESPMIEDGLDVRHITDHHNVPMYITTRMPFVHGAPIHLGNPSAIGIKDIDKPDFGEPSEIKEGEIPVFWACGVTPQAAAMTVKPDIMITHAPGHMFITDILNSKLAIM